MARTTKEQAQKTSEKLILTAIDQFMEHGVQATTLEQIAEAAGVTRGAIYSRYKNKTDLVLAVHDHFHLAILETINTELKALNKPPLQRLRTVWEKFLNDLATNDMYRKVLTIFLLKCDYSGDLNILLSEQIACKGTAQRMIIKCFQEALDRGDLKPRYSAELLAQTQSCYIHGIITEYIARGKTQALRKEAPRLIDFYFSGLPTREK